MDARVKRAAQALVERGDHVSVSGVSHAGMSPASNNGLLRIHRLRMRKQRTAATRYAFEYGGFFAWAFILVSFFHVRRAYHVVYAHNMPNFLVFAGLIPKIAGARIVLDIHDPAAELLACIPVRQPPPFPQPLATPEERL